MRAGRDLAEPDGVVFDEQFDAKNSASAERSGNGLSNAPRFAQCRRRHGLRLPAFAIVAVDLEVADRFAERRAASVPHCQECDLVIEIDKSFDDNFALSGPAAFLGVAPALFDVR